MIDLFNKGYTGNNKDELLNILKGYVYPTNIPSNTDLDSIVELGMYVCISGTTVQTLSHLPKDYKNSSFTMYVIYIGSTLRVLQILVPNNLNVGIYKRRSETDKTFVAEWEYSDYNVIGTVGGTEENILYGDTTNRGGIRTSRLRIGHQYFDTSLGKPIYWNGTAWVDATGILSNTPTKGTFANKPTVSNNAIPIGFRYFCTDKQTTEGATNGIEIIHKGNDVWVDALGRVVS